MQEPKTSVNFVVVAYTTTTKTASYEEIVREINEALQAVNGKTTTPAI